MPYRTRPVAISIVFTAALAVTAACTVPPPSANTTAAPPAAKSHAAVEAESAAPEASPENASPPPPPATVAVAPEPPPPPAPSILRGLSGAEVTRLIGAPRFRRSEDPSALWQYAAPGCILDLYLRSDGSDYRVVHYEFRPDPKTARNGTASGGVDAQTCFAAMARRGGESRG